MAALVPLIQEILPMILPGSISVTKSAEVLPPPPPPPTSKESEALPPPPEASVRVVSRNAVVGKSDKLCASVLILKPLSSTSVHHHGEQEAIIYVSSGRGVLLGPPKDDEVDAQPERHELEPGDFAHISSWVEHQILNESFDTELQLVITQSGGQPVEAELTGWGGSTAR
ncbi:RmlC-like cupin domain-containing protein [Podospora fimiseda]|uniref:RmlC-like cupin domain-containing protein n=1 Tax=Podospora fimiseda TaxID=252190 RepID=A0AAN7BPX8_9PEZI|nr:RmlC-like cupin domain-containing protein [Podospora fimiseda]